MPTFLVGAENRAASPTAGLGLGVKGGLFTDTQGDEAALVEDPAYRPTKAARCKVHGEGLAVATTRRVATFTIESFDENGERQTRGGDNFFVSVRGRGERVHARVTDKQEGTYEVTFKPITIGKYLISASLCGEPLPGSPFLCHVGTPTPSAPHCILRGRALTHATARKEEAFEILFRDALNQIAHAEELDVYVGELTEEELQQAIASPRVTDSAPATAIVAAAAKKQQGAPTSGKPSSGGAPPPRASAAPAESSAHDGEPAMPSSRPSGAEGMINMVMRLHTHKLHLRCLRCLICEPYCLRASTLASALASLCQHLFISPISSTGYTLTVESSPSGPTALVPLGDPD